MRLPITIVSLVITFESYVAGNCAPIEILNCKDFMNTNFQERRVN